MPWAKFSDTFGMHSLITGILATRGADSRSINEVTGFITRCATHSAGIMTDYYVDVATAQAIGGTHWQKLIGQAMEAGLITREEGEGYGRRWRLVEASDELFHIRYETDVRWDRQRDKDRRNLALTMPVRLRDGDVCRYCDQTVTWSDHRGGRGGTFDHVVPGQPATIDTFVVSCKSCNSKRQDNPSALALRPAPLVPHFSPGSDSIEKLTDYFGPERTTHLLRPGTQPVHAQRPSSDTAPRPASQADTARSTAVARPDGDTASWVVPSVEQATPQPRDNATDAGQLRPEERAPGSPSGGPPPWFRATGPPAPESAEPVENQRVRGLAPGSGRGTGSGSGRVPEAAVPRARAPSDRRRGRSRRGR